jgi:ankyrin repeat protein
VKRILKNNPKAINNTDALGNTSLHLAAEQGHLSIVHYLVTTAQHEGDGPSKNNAGDAALMAAAAVGHEDIVHFLATQFPQTVDWRNKAGATAMMMAAQGGRDAVVNVKNSFFLLLFLSLIPRAFFLCGVLIFCVCWLRCFRSC